MAVSTPKRLKMDDFSPYQAEDLSRPNWCWMSGGFLESTSLHPRLEGWGSWVLVLLKDGSCNSREDELAINTSRQAGTKLKHFPRTSLYLGHFQKVPPTFKVGPCTSINLVKKILYRFAQILVSVLMIDTVKLTTMVIHHNSLLLKHISVQLDYWQVLDSHRWPAVTITMDSMVFASLQSPRCVWKDYIEAFRLNF